MNRWFLIVLFLSVFGSLIAQSDGDSSEWEELKELILKTQAKDDIDSALFYCKQLSVLAKKDVVLQMETSMTKMRVLMHFNRSAEAYEIGLVCFAKYCEDDDINCSSCSRLSRLQSDLFWMLKEYEMAIEYLEQDCSRNSSWYVKKAGLFYELNDTVEAYNLLRDESLIPNNIDDQISWHFGVGIVFRKSGALDEALTSYNRALELIKEHRPKSTNKPTIIGNIGEIYLIKGDLEKAKICLEEDAKGSFENGEYSSFVLAEIYLGEINIKLGRFAETKDRLQDILENYSTYLSFGMKVKMINLILKSNLKLGKELDYRRMLERKSDLLEEKYKLDAVDYRGLIRYYAANAVKNVETKMSLDQQILEKEVAIVNEREYQANLRSIIIIVSLVLLLIIGYLFFRKYKTSNEQKSLLKDAKLRLNDQEKEILAWRVDEEQRNVKELSIELGIKSDFTSSLNSELKKLDSISISERKSLEIFVQTELGIKSIRANLQDLIGDSESRFIATLRKKHPTVSDNDISLALMVVLQHSNKEISIKKSITEGSVKMAKHRLKQKLNLSSEERMFNYLEGVLNDK